MFALSFFFTTALAASSLPKDLQVNDTASILGVAKNLASGVMSYYPGSAKAYADLPAPYYWWECGALFGAMLDYSHYTGDTQYDEKIATAVMAQAGPNNDYMLPAHYGDEGNDDQAFWGFAVMSAAERNFSQPAALTPTGVPGWLTLGTNIWGSLVSRWNTTHCNGGFTWQIFASNPNGLNYKNSVSNGGVFQLSARLAKLTGNATYLDWAARIWDWTEGVGLIDSQWAVYDGVGAEDNCSTVNPLSFSYAAGIYLYGAAVLANHTGSAVWAARAAGLLQGTQSFFGPFDNASNIMWEHACEGVNTCNTDMKSFKGYLARFMYAAAAVQPSLAPTVATYMRASAQAAGIACSGPTTNASAVCGQKWYVGGFDNSVGLGQQMSALEAIQGLLVL